ncbi:MAG: serine hydrolase [Bryobacteraceae bacterium]|jgi:CubicO group peptidase (beta-lactamase class C family)
MFRSLSVAAFCALLLSSFLTQAASAQTSASYFPGRGKWEKKAPAELGLDAAKLQEAVRYALAHGSDWDFARDQVKTFGPPLGPLPAQRASTNGIILRHGYIAAEFGDIKAADPVYSVAKSFISTVCSVAVAQGLIKNVNDPVANYIRDGGYDSPHNAKITWKNHLQQESEWEGNMWGKNADFVGVEQFGDGKMRPRAIREPGTYYEYNDVRINRFSLSLLRLFGKSLPDVLKENIMDPIGASSTWRWVPYNNSTVDIDGKRIASVSGGTRWGGGLWIDSEDLARFGLLILNHGNWKGKQLVSAEWLHDAVQPSAHGPDYGYLWWLNTRKKEWPSAPTSSFAAIGNGSNTIWIDPDHDIVFVWHWFQGNSMDGMLRTLMSAVNGA